MIQVNNIDSCYFLIYLSTLIFFLFEETPSPEKCTLGVQVNE